MSTTEPTDENTPGEVETEETIETDDEVAGHRLHRRVANRGVDPKERMA